MFMDGSAPNLSTSGVKNWSQRSLGDKNGTRIRERMMDFSLLAQFVTKHMKYLDINNPIRVAIHTQ
jgi:hypothetical protein